MNHRRECPKLRLLIIGQQDSFGHILTTNIQNWGHDVQVLSISSTMRETRAEGDILLYDLDEAHNLSVLAKRAQIPAKEILSLSPLLGNENNTDQIQWPRVRFTIALSSRSVSRSMLDQIGAVALLQKPFEMSRLQRYLHVLQRLLLEPETTQPVGEKRRILVVDDDFAIANAVQQCLIGESGYEVAVAYDGLEALEQCLDWRPDCIVTDLIMPWMNGYQVMRCLNAVSLQNTPAFVIMSALNQFEVPWNRSYMRSNIVEYVDKPFNIDRLLSAIEQVCVMHSV
ncbi:MAG TPA: response regulator [Ktedonobacteraceae bacterium]|nr:response regulator [Ktedonobacteraceae bacterium]